MQKMLTYDQIYEQYYPYLVRYVFKMIYSWEEAENIAQETMLKAWLHWEEIQDKLDKWLFRVAHNATVDYIRRANRITITDIAITDTKHPSDMAEVVALSSLIDDLPERYRQVIKLRVQQYPDKDIADILHITPTDSKTRANRARILARKMVA